ncbi:MAG: malto-oligosyltrehalose trehalohydrolase, partial [Ilumatobacteraceae bacterium]
SAATGSGEPVGAGGSGWWGVDVPGVGHGWRYRYSLGGGPWLPDPASGWQPDGVHGASAVVDVGRFAWTDHEWRGVPLAASVIYELHVGTFTPEGTFDAAIGQLDRLAALGVTIVEVMPVNAFPGERNWGYDGVFAYAVQHSYGGPEAFARFVDAAHARGLAVLLDVVYNHLGPEGNVLHQYGPYFTDQYVTPWGPAVNVAGPGSDGTRRWILENARRWVRDFHLDGFRLDAVHALVDPTAVPIWEQIGVVAHAEGAIARRTVTVIAESSDNDPRYVRGADRGGHGLDAVWNDDVHHALRVALTGERDGYYADYSGTAAELADIVEHRWLFRDRYSIFRGRRHGRPADDVAPHRFVVAAMTHDQVGNRPAGDRPALDPARRRLAAATIALLPSTPMLFMGEEYDDPAPFPFFVDHGDPEILEATRRGRRAEFAQHDWDGDDQDGGVPDPADPATMRAAVLDPSRAEREPHRSMLAMYTELYRLRRNVEPVRSPAARQRVEHHDTAMAVHRALLDRDGVTVTAACTLAVNLGDTEVTVPLGAEHADRAVTVAFDSADERWGGPGAASAVTGDPGARAVSVGPLTVALLTS